MLFKRAGWKVQVGMTDEERLESARRWLQYASDDLQFAEDAAKDANRPARFVCLHARQSAEKALKAVLVSTKSTSHGPIT